MELAQQLFDNQQLQHGRTQDAQWNCALNVDAGQDTDGCCTKAVEGTFDTGNADGIDSQVVHSCPKHKKAFSDSARNIPISIASETRSD